jgi:hypothetical protein
MVFMVKILGVLGADVGEKNLFLIKNSINHRT